MANELEKNFSENLKYLIARKNLTLTSAARKVGMNKSTLHNYCNGVIPRNLMKIKELADLLGVSFNELLSVDRQINMEALSHQLNGRFEVSIRRVDNLK